MRQLFLWMKAFYTGCMFLPFTASTWMNAAGQQTSEAAKPYEDAYRKEVPVLCYHQVREYQSGDSKSARSYIIPQQQFNAHMKMLHDSGYHTVLPDQLLNWYRENVPLPVKPVMLTFDDGTISQYENALPVLEKYNFKAVFFIMTVTLNRPNYLTRQQIKALNDKGHEIGCHTWDHHMVTKYNETDWNTQLTKPTEQLEEITGKKIKYFAYPFGIWDNNAVTRLKKHNYAAAFQLSSRQRGNEPQFTISRIIADGS